MKLTVVGSADAFNSSGRAHSCYLLRSDNAGTLMVDFGATALMRLNQLGVSPTELDGLVFTHMHGDHIGGFPFLLIDALYNHPRRRALPVLGPPLTAASLTRLIDACYPGHHSHLPDVPVEISEFGPGETRSFLGYRIEAFAAAHMEAPHRALCLRITDAAGTSIAFSGDTRPCAGLREAASGSALLVAECTRLAPPVGDHTTWQDWQRELQTIGARSVLLTHLGEDVRGALPSLQTAAASGVPFRFAEDGLELEV